MSSIINYSNNYSKYIEKLKFEKSQKAFQQMVNSTQENKSGKILFEENYSDKKVVSAASAYGTDSTKDYGKLDYEDSDNHYKNSKKIESNEAYINQKEYDAISTRVDIKNPEKIKNDISRVEFDSSDFSVKTNFENTEESKSGDKISAVTINEERDGKKAEFETTIENKNGLEINHERIETAKNNDNNIEIEYSPSEKDLNNISNASLDSQKNRDDLIFSIKEEKKARKLFSQRASSGNKLEGEFQHLTAGPKKTEVTNLNRQSPNFSHDKAWEQDYYISNAAEYKYYPFGSYSEINSTQSNAITDAFHTITNASNWSTPGKAIVSSLKVATDVIDMINLVGPSRNIYNSNTANNLRWDLKIASEELNSEKDEINGAISYSYKKTVNDTNGNKKSIWGRSIDITDASLEKEKDDVSINEKLKSQSEDEDGNLADGSVKNEQKQLPGILSNEEETLPLADYEPDKDGISIDEKLKSQFNDDDGNLAENNGKDDKKEIDGDFKNGDASVYGITDFTLGFKGLVINDKDDISIDEKLKSQFNDDADGNLAENNTKDTTIIGEETKLSEEEAKYQPDVTKGNFAYISSEDSESNRWFDDYGYLGKIYVIPPYKQLANTKPESNNDGDETSNNVDVAFRIPLQNNLQFEQISRAAAYNAIQFFGRIGDVQQYSRTGSLDLINLTTKYFVEDEDGSSGKFTMANLQDIEMMYRSLVLPIESSANYLSGDSANSAYYYFTRPPLINIVLNNDGVNDGVPGRNNITDKITEVYNNLFTEIKSNYNEGSGKIEHNIFYKNFVVTNVTIDKNDNEYNYYVDFGKKKYYDKMGFTVTLTILEIDENYLGSISSFNNYYNTLKSRNLLLTPGA